MSYYNQYIKCKNKYAILKMQNDMKMNHHFYFIHGTRDINSILSIIKDGTIRPGKYIPANKRKHSGDQPLDYIYMNIYFENLKNLSHMWDYAIILSPKIIREYDAIFNKGWQVGPWKDSIHFNISDTPNTFNKKIDEVREFIKNPDTLPKIVQDAPGMMHHEFIFENDIPLKNNLIGIACNGCSQINLNKIKKAIKKYSFGDMPIFTRNYPLPKLDELVDTTPS